MPQIEFPATGLPSAQTPGNAGAVIVTGCPTGMRQARVRVITGLGYLIMQAGDYLNTALVFSGIIMIAILGLVLDACLRGLLLLADPSRRR